MKFRYLIAALALTIAATDSMAGPFRRRAQPVYQPSYQQASQPTYQPASSSPTSMPLAGTPDAGYVSFYTPSTPIIPTATPLTLAPLATDTEYPIASPAGISNGMEGDGLDEVNAKRAARGLRPYIRDEGLAQAARACASFRAQHGLFGHTSNDFGFIPAGSSASSAGCAAYPAGYGWMSCCTYDNYTYAGAAWVTGRDGQRYMHLYVR